MGEERKKLGMEDGVAKVQQVLRHLPHDLVVEHILTRLPVKPLIRFKCVSKQWYSDISSYQFSQLYSKLSLFSGSFSPTQYLLIPSVKSGNNYNLLIHDDYDMSTPTFNVNQNLFELRILDVQEENLVLIGSCNGLVCLASSYGDFFILWNPFTGIFKKYSDLEFPINDSPVYRFEIIWGFGYVTNVDDFKVIRILKEFGTKTFRVDVFSLKSNKWTRIADNQPTIGIEVSHWYIFQFSSSQGVRINETYYWIVYFKMEGMNKIILSFDLDSEEFDFIFDLDLSTRHVEEFLCNIGGCLSKYRINMLGNVSIHMLKYPGKVESIQLPKDLPVNCCIDLVGSTRTNKFFIHSRDSVVGIIDPTSEPMKYTQLALLESSGSELSSIYAISGTSKSASLVPSLTFPYTVEECCSGN